MTIEKLTAGDPDTQSADIVSDHLDRLRELFPEAFTEGRIDFDVLRQVLGDDIEDGDERYGLNWRGKRAARRLALTPSAGTLRPAIEASVDWDTTQNLMIEGDNLEVLKLLQKSYAGKVKMIYIDPPYNTGRDFVYRDRFQDSIQNYLEITGQVDGGVRLTSNTETSGRFHTDWLNMMYPRLYAARDLLRDDGIIFVSIDDTEVRNLRSICDEVFGETNFVAMIARVTKRSSNAGTHFSPSKDYIACYARNRDAVANFSVALNDEQVKSFNRKDERGHYKEIGLYQAALKHGGSIYKIECPDGSYVIPPGTVPWRWSENTFREGLLNNLIVFKETGQSPLLDAETGARSKWNVYTKLYLDARIDDGLVPKDFIEDIQNTLATRELTELGIEFDFAKPTRLIAYLARLIRADDAIVLDFFAGSGTTAHAVLDLNAEDGGNRKFILVQLPELTGQPQYPTIADICRERVRRVTKKLKVEAEGKLDLDGTHQSQDLGFRVFKLDSSNIREWDPQTQDLEATLDTAVENLKADRTEQDILYELLLKRGIELSVPIDEREIAGKAVQSIGAGTLFTCLAENIERTDAEPLALGIVAWHGALNPAGETRVVFRDTAFVDDVAKTNLAEILRQHGLADVKSI